MKVITFGEIMMRLNPPGYLRFLQTDTFEATYAGGEANVAPTIKTMSRSFPRFPKTKSARTP